MDLFERAERGLEARLGKAIGRGRNRVVFRDGDTVVKVPTTETGTHCNYYESFTWDSQCEPRAKAWIDEALSDEFGVPMLRMEYAEHVGFSKKPDWTWSVDCGQVGRTKEGRLVAYDWDRY